MVSEGSLDHILKQLVLVTRVGSRDQVLPVSEDSWVPVHGSSLVRVVLCRVICEEGVATTAMSEAIGSGGVVAILELDVLGVGNAVLLAKERRPSVHGLERLVVVASNVGQVEFLRALFGPAFAVAIEGLSVAVEVLVEPLFAD